MLDPSTMGKKDIQRLLTYVRPPYNEPKQCDFPTEKMPIRRRRKDGSTYVVMIPKERCGDKALVTVTFDGNIHNRCPKHAKHGS